MAVTKTMTIGKILGLHAGVAGLLEAAGMHCLGCPAAQGETLEEACGVHGTDPQALVEAINGLLVNG